MINLDYAVVKFESEQPTFRGLQPSGLQANEGTFSVERVEATPEQLADIRTDETVRAAPGAAESAGGGLVTIQRLLGRSALSATAKYLHVTQKHLDSVKSPLELLRMPNADDLE